MEDYDPSLEPLYELIEKLICDVYQQQQPGLVNIIRQLVRNGYNPTAISNWVKARIPTTSQLDDDVYLIAMYLFRQQLSSN